MSTSAPEITEFAGRATVVVRRDNLLVDDLADFMDESFTALGIAIRDGRFTPIGAGFTRYNSEMTETVALEVGFPVERPWEEFAKVGDVTLLGSELPAGTVAVAQYRGGYDDIAKAWTLMLERIVERGYHARRPFWESYDVPPIPGRQEKDYLTRLVAPVGR